MLGAGLLLPACRKQPEKTQATLERISESVYASGTIKSKNQYQVFSTVSGLVQKILVQEGDVVRKGDPLFVVQHESAALNAQNAQLAADFAARNSRGERLQELTASIETAQSKMLNDSLLLVRQRGLWAQQIGSRVELEQRELAYTASLNSYRAAVLRYRDLQKQLDFAAAQSQKLLAISKTMAQDYVIRSQTDGRVYNITLEPGEIVSMQSPVAIIGDAVEFVAELQVDENDIARIRPGQRVLLTLDSYKGQVYEAELTRIDPFMNERSRTFAVEAIFTKKPPVLYPNLTAEANIVIQTKDNALTIPRAYLIGDSVVILEDKTQRSVKTGLKDFRKAEILEGLSPRQTILKPAP
ncbi:MAG: HlyD family efflux transporter periplasmic adaptor subunit [Saprospiraceae bacterium]|nr:HlyD family efflux transporter periplasmic adaptor subunit [Saprospiraceae bacterium]